MGCLLPPVGADSERGSGMPQPEVSSETARLTWSQDCGGPAALLTPVLPGVQSLTARSLPCGSLCGAAQGKAATEESRRGKPGDSLVAPGSHLRGGRPPLLSHPVLQQGGPSPPAAFRLCLWGRGSHSASVLRLPGHRRTSFLSVTHPGYLVWGEERVNTQRLSHHDVLVTWISSASAMVHAMCIVPGEDATESSCFTVNKTTAVI